MGDVGFGWAVFYPPWSASAGQPCEWAVRSQRRDAQATVAEAWRRDGDRNVGQSWKRAYRNGWRCYRVSIRRFGA